MIAEPLLMVTMGAAFFVIPFVVLLCSAIFLAFWLRGSSANANTKRHLSDAVPVLKDALTVAVVLSLTGFATVLFLSGDVSLGDYVSVPKRVLEVLEESVTDWTQPFSAEAIAVRGGVFIVVVATTGAAVALISYLRRSLAETDPSSQRSAGSSLDLSR
ncbi:MAG: hypothetical protein M3280_07380 [Actinomycetota bacterium]|nr:hypothetical protein [Actinomycetota bacterium]